MASLLDKSLNSSSNGEPRFTMLETIHEYALESWRKAGTSRFTTTARKFFWHGLKLQDAMPDRIEQNTTTCAGRWTGIYRTM
jgi:hypothetical protein